MSRSPGLRWVLIGAGLLVAAQVVAIVAAPRRDDAGLGSLPPGEFAGTLMLGGFRGLACDLLWLRAVSSKDQGRFYESVALTEAITRVQPHFSDVWQHLAHDLAYNIAFEADGEEQRHAWFVAGVRANIRGVERNPGVERLLRHLAWMFHHRGDMFKDRILAADWSGQLNPLLAEVRRRTGDDPRAADLSAGAGSSNFVIAGRLYAACVALGDAKRRSGGASQPTFVRRMMAHCIAADGNRLRNIGEHLAAVRRWLDAAEEWERIARWMEEPGIDAAERSARASSGLVLERTEGRLRRDAADLVLLLAPDAASGEAAAAAIQDRRWEEARRLLASAGWRPSAGSDLRIQWLDR